MRSLVGKEDKCLHAALPVIKRPTNCLRGSKSTFAVRCVVTLVPETARPSQQKHRVSPWGELETEVHVLRMPTEKENLAFRYSCDEKEFDFANRVSCLFFSEAEAVYLSISLVTIFRKSFHSYIIDKHRLTPAACCRWRNKWNMDRISVSAVEHQKCTPATMSSSSCALTINKKAWSFVEFSITSCNASFTDFCCSRYSKPTTKRRLQWTTCVWTCTKDKLTCCSDTTAPARPQPCQYSQVCLNFDANCCFLSCSIKKFSQVRKTVCREDCRSSIF